MEALGINVGYLILQIACFAGLVIAPIGIIAAAVYYWLHYRKKNA